MSFVLGGQVVGLFGNGCFDARVFDLWLCWCLCGVFCVGVGLVGFWIGLLCGWFSSLVGIV